MKDFFSSLKHIKSYLRKTIGDERLSDLMVINVEGEASKIHLEEAVDIFSKMKKTKISFN